MICDHISCYSNCNIDYKANIPSMLSSTFRGSCPTCKHSLRDHRSHYARWEKVTDIQVSVEHDMKKKWEMAKGAKAKREVFIAACRKARNDPQKVIIPVTDLRWQVEQHESLSLAGSFAAQVSSAVELLELRYEALREKDVGPDQLKQVMTSLDRMKTRLAILNHAKGDRQESTIWIRS